MKAEVVVITGGTGAGKSTVAELIRGLGYPVIDSDVGARAVLEPAWKGLMPSPLARIHERWPQCFDANLVLDRKALGRIVFADHVQRDALESIMTPHIEAYCQLMIWHSVMSGQELVFLDSPLYFESGEMQAYRAASWNIGMPFNIAAIFLITAPESVRVARTVKRDGVSEEVVRGRMAAQLSDVERRRKAETYKHLFTFDGTEPLDVLEVQVGRSVGILKSLR